MLKPEIEARIAERWKQAYGAQTEPDLRALYADWAQTYDEEHAAIVSFDLNSENHTNRRLRTSHRICRSQTFQVQGL